MLVYVDDVLAISHDPGEIMKIIGMTFEIKNDEYGPPTQYLGADVETFTLQDGSKAWSFLSTSYVRNAVDTVKRLLAEDGRELKSGARPHKGTCHRDTNLSSIPPRNATSNTCRDTNS